MERGQDRGGPQGDRRRSRTMSGGLHLPALRSLLFVPALKARYWEKALGTAAGAFIVDLEDSVGADLKNEARDALPQAVLALNMGNRPVLVRVNANDRADLEAAARLPIQGLILPKVEGPDAVDQASALSGDLPILASIESPLGLERAGAIADRKGVAALMFGAGDFIAETGMADDDDLLSTPALLMVLAAKARRLPAFGLPGTIAEFRDLERLGTLARKARAMGFSGTPAIHPDQIGVLNQAFGPTSRDLREARAVIAAFEASDGSAFMSEGKLIERAVYESALSVIRNGEEIDPDLARVSTAPREEP